MTKVKSYRITPDNNSNRLDTKVTQILKYLSNFWRSLDVALINCRIKFDFTCSKK